MTSDSMIQASASLQSAASRAAQHVQSAQAKPRLGSMAAAPPPPGPAPLPILPRAAPGDIAVPVVQMRGIINNSSNVDSAGLASLDRSTAFSLPPLDLVDDPLKVRMAETVRDAAPEKPSADVTGTPAAAGAPDVVDPVRRKRLEEIAGYGDSPENLLAAVFYFLKVVVRRRVLDQELDLLIASRKRSEMLADDALCALADALFAKREDPGLKPIGAQLRVVEQSHAQLGQKQSAGASADAARKEELARLAQEITALDTLLSPLRQREAELQKDVDGFVAQMRRREAQLRHLDAELAKLKSGKDAAPPERLAANESERRVHQSEIEALDAQQRPLLDELTTLRSEIAERVGTLAALREEEAATTRAMTREQQRHRASTDGALGAHREALKALALAAQRTNLAGRAAEQDKAVTAAGARVKQKLDDEAMHRESTGAFDRAGYRRGLLVAVGAVLAVVFGTVARVVL